MSKKKHVPSPVAKFIRVSIVAGDDIAGYDPQEDADLCEYWKAEDRYWQG
jgi:hypothetical protein